jgi:8-amino-7-oxononanoate synthase
LSSGTVAPLFVGGPAHQGGSSSSPLSAQVCYYWVVSGELDRFAERRLGELANAGLLRKSDDGSRRRAAEAAADRLGVPFVDASSNDYLGLAGQDVSRETRVQVGAAGAGASRLIHGTRRALVDLETRLAEWVGAPEALLFTSGYAANVGLLTAVGVAGSTILSDQLNHASIVDGCRLARAEVKVVPHLDLTAMETALRNCQGTSSRWVITESCFSMDGDGPDLVALRTLCDRFDAGLLVDEAHALGVFGAKGAGRCAEAGVVPDALVGTLGKAVGTQGAFVAGSPMLRELLWNQARSFVFSTATSPLLASVTLLHVERLKAADSARALAIGRASLLRDALVRRGIQVPQGLGGPIVPVLVGDNDQAVRVADTLEANGILAQAIRPPTVPVGSARLRLTVSASWPDDVIDRVASAVAEALTRAA